MQVKTQSTTRPAPQRASTFLATKANLLADRATWMLVLVLLAYPLLGTLVAFTSLPSSVASYPVRALILFLSVSIIYYSSRNVLSVPAYRVVLVFWILYFVRLVWDMFVAQIPVAGQFMFSFIAFCIIPSLALMHFPKIDERKLTWRLLLIGILACVLALVAGYTNLAAGRSTTEEAEGRLFLETVNPITYGHVGVTTILAALCVARYCKYRIQWVLLAVALVLGAMTVKLAGSRGPFISLLLPTVTLALLNRHYRWLLLVVVGIAFWMFAGVSEDSSNLIAARLVASTSGNNTEIRILMQAGAIEQFLDSPLVGSAIIERQFEEYPHNPIIESAMALGILGLLSMLFILLRALVGIARKFRAGGLMLPLIGIQYITAAQFSGSMAESASLWMLLALLLGNDTQPFQSAKSQNSRMSASRHSSIIP